MIDLAGRTFLALWPVLLFACALVGMLIVADRRDTKRTEAVEPGRDYSYRTCPVRGDRP